MQKHELLLKIRYQTRSEEPLLSALAVEKALAAHYQLFTDLNCELTYQNDPYGTPGGADDLADLLS